jgi:hypothetical protein
MQNLLSHIHGIFDAESPTSDLIEERMDLLAHRSPSEDPQDPKRPFQNLFDMQRSSKLTQPHFYE